MPFCEFCGQEIGYLPFKCKYCAGIYCQNHRLPENHECSFKVKHTAVSPHVKESRPLYQDTYARPSERDYEYRPRRQKRIKQPNMGLFNTGFGNTRQPNGTIWMIILILTFSISAIFIPFLLCLTITGVLLSFYWIIFTSLFISYSYGWYLYSLMNLFLMLFFFYMNAKNIELQFGTKFLIKLYFFCAGFSALFYILISLALVSIDPIFFYYPFGGFALGAMYGIMLFFIFFNPNREIVSFCCFIPIKMKGRSFIILIILSQLIFVLLDTYYIVIFISDLGGIVASYLVYYRKFKYRRG